MSEPLLGEIRVLSPNFAPREWALSNGQLKPINQKEALFALQGTTYGGDDGVKFAVRGPQLHRPAGILPAAVVAMRAALTTHRSRPAGRGLS